MQLQGSEIPGIMHAGSAVPQPALRSQEALSTMLQSGALSHHHETVSCYASICSFVTALHELAVKIHEALDRTLVKRRNSVWLDDHLGGESSCQLHYEEIARLPMSLVLRLHVQKKISIIGRRGCNILEEGLLSNPANLDPTLQRDS